MEGAFQRLGFACTLGLAALVVTIILWTVSVPWVAWCLLRWVRPAVSVSHVFSDSAHRNQTSDRTRCRNEYKPFLATLFMHTAHTLSCGKRRCEVCAL